MGEFRRRKPPWCQHRRPYAAVFMPFHCEFQDRQSTMPPKWAASWNSLELDDSVTQQCRRPGKTATECFQQQVLAALHLARTHGVIERQRHRASRGIGM